MNNYDLPTSLTIGEVVHPIRYGWRAVMDIFNAFNDPELDQEDRTDIMIRILYPKWREIPFRDMPEAIEKACNFLDCGKSREDNRNRPRLVDWGLDARIIIPEINKVAKTEVRANPDMHWWTFFGWYMAIEGGLFGTVVHIRKKQSTGKKLDKWEEEFYRENRELVDLPKVLSDEEKAAQAYFDKWL